VPLQRPGRPVVEVSGEGEVKRPLPALARGAACKRWERALYLSISGDLNDGAARALERHLARCSGCRKELEAARQLRERCLEVPRERRTPPRWTGAWSGIQAALSGVLPGEANSWPRPETPAWRRSRWPLRLAASLAIGAGTLAWFAVKEAFEDDVGPGNRTVLEARWAEKWNEFVSGAEPRGGILIDPFAPEIPHPDSIDF